MTKKFNRGFTLIELLVVIAIIGILSSVVLASLNQARSKGSDGAIKADVAGIRAAAEVYYDTNNGYGTQAYTADCGGTVAGMFNDSTVQAQIDDAVTKSGQTAASAAKCASSAGAYVIAVMLKGTTTPANFGWCVDSVGSSQQIYWNNFVSGETTCAAAAS